MRWVRRLYSSWGRPGVVRREFVRIACILLVLEAVPVLAAGDEPFDAKSWRWADEATEPVYSVAVFGGEGTERNLTDTLENLFDFQGSSDRMIAVAGGRRIAWYRDLFSIDGELFYARHYGRERYHEFGVTVYARWHKFPWSRHVVTSIAAGIGPTYTTIYPELEVQDNDEDRSRILNQFNLELTLALPEYPRTSLMVRLQHRSGIFGTINGVYDASNFLTLGLRQAF